jgi:DNA replication protein DnaC
VVDARSGRGSTAFVTNVDFSDWTEHLGDPPLVMALLDRVVDIDPFCLELDRVVCLA